MIALLVVVLDQCASPRLSEEDKNYIDGLILLRCILTLWVLFCWTDVNCTRQDAG